MCCIAVKNKCSVNISIAATCDTEHSFQLACSCSYSSETMDSLVRSNRMCQLQSSESDGLQMMGCKQEHPAFHEPTWHLGELDFAHAMFPDALLEWHMLWCVKCDRRIRLMWCMIQTEDCRCCGANRNLQLSTSPHGISGSSAFFAI